MNHKAKVTVIDKKLYPELQQQQYCADPSSGICSCYNVGNEFVFYRHGRVERLPSSRGGRELFEATKVCAADKGYSFMQVKTVQMGKYREYDETNRFYINMGFKEFEVFPTLWDE